MSPSSRWIVRVEGERSRVVAEPPLDLHRVATLGEQHRRACVAEGVESDPLQARLLARRLEHAAADVALVQALRCSPETPSPRRPATPTFAVLAQLQHEHVVERYLPFAVLALGRPMRPFTSARRTLTCGVDPSSSRRRHWSATASLIRKPVEARNKKNIRQLSGSTPSSVDSSSWLIARTSSSSDSSAVGRCGRSTSRAGFPDRSGPRGRPWRGTRAAGLRCCAPSGRQGAALPAWRGRTAIPRNPRSRSA